MISEITLELIKQLHNRVEEVYGCIPQAIKWGDSVGFNVSGRETGRVEQRDSHVYSTFYSPDSQPDLPVFA